MEKWALITGATAGIGEATAKKLAANKWSLIITGRRHDRLQTLQKELTEQNDVAVKNICFDVSDRSACESVFKEHHETFKKTQALINNAGLACGVDKIQEANIDDWEQMIDTNVKGLLYVTRLCLPHLLEQPQAHIVNIGSVAGRWSYPGGGVYCSTKFAVRAISEGLRMDLHGKNVRVTNISPGLVETEFSQVRLRDDQKAKAVYHGLDALTANDIADCVEWSLNRPAHVNIQEMVVFPTAQASVTQVHRT